METVCTKSADYNVSRFTTFNFKIKTQCRVSTRNVCTRRSGGDDTLNPAHCRGAPTLDIPIGQCSRFSRYKQPPLQRSLALKSGPEQGTHSLFFLNTRNTPRSRWWPNCAMWWMRGVAVDVLRKIKNQKVVVSHIYVRLQQRLVWNQFPLVHCSCCLDVGYEKRFCKDVSDKYAHCGEHDVAVKCQSQSEGGSRKCINCIMVGREDMESANTTDTAGLASCRCISKGTGLLDRISNPCDMSARNSDKITLGGDVNVWSVWWGSERDDAHGVDICDIFDAERLHNLN
ncbi:hypothetical protein EVAR_32513_1 [Eumeta japonica]|uniref:Endonuclease/exonuclease/phosphatase domain-containing protein n=1 Tax=Eumeta variegata TaxID=151549 RepID=A0A4C1WA38_EUMVA|nr:hypothetical protein EVAR_32513_1 [Eumeta japonica]